MGGPRAQRSYANAERGISRVNSQMKQHNFLSGIFGNRWVMIGGAVTAAAPLIVRLAGSMTQLVASLVQAGGGAAVVGGGALGAFVVGALSVMSVVKPLQTDIKNTSKAFDAYNKAVATYGASSTQAARAQRSLNAAQRAAPAGTLALIQHVKALGKEWRNTTKEARGYLVQLADYAVTRARQSLPQIGQMVTANVRAVGGAGRGMVDRLLDPANLTILARISTTFRRDLPPASDAIVNIALSFGRMIADAGPFVRQFLVMFDRWTQHLDVATRDTTYITYRMHELVAEFRNWTHFLGVSFRLLNTLFTAATRTHTSLKGITGTFEAWTRWMQNNPLKMQRFFENSAQASHDLGAALMFVVRLFARLSVALDPIWQSLRRILGSVAGPLLMLLTQVAQTLAIIGQGLGGMGGPLAIMLHALSSVLSIVNTLLRHIPLLGTVLAGALTVIGIVKMVTWMGRFVGLIPKGQSEMAALTVATNGAAAATERLAMAQRFAGGGIGGIPVGGGGVLRAGERVTGGGVILPGGVRSVPTAIEAEAATAGRLGILGRARALPGAMRAGIGMRLAGGARALAGPVGIAGLIAATMLPSVVPGRTGRVLGGVATGASMGALAGSILPGPGTLIGAGIGGLAGGLFSAFSGGGGGGSDARLAAYNRALTGYDTTAGAHRARTGFISAGRGGMIPRYGMVGGTTVHHAGLNAQLGRFGGDNAHTAAQIAGQLHVLRRYAGMLRGDTSQGAQAALAALQSQIATRAAVLPGVRQTERHAQFTGAFGLGQNLMRGYNIVAPTQGAARGMEFVTQQALARWSKLGPEGKRVLARGLISWAEQMRQSNPALAGQFEALKNSIIGKFVQVRGVIHMVHGQILTGTKSEWRRIGAAMANPVEQAQQAITRNLTIIQQRAVGSLAAMGFDPASAQSIVRSIEGGGTSGTAASRQAAAGPGAHISTFTGIPTYGAGPAGGPTGSRGPSVRGGLHSGVRTLAGEVMGKFPGLTITSGLRPQDARSYHSRGMAVDLAGPGMGAAARWISNRLGGSLLEGIHNTGLSVKNGQYVDPSFWGASTWAAHANHIHLAIGDNGVGGGGARGGLSTGTGRGGRVTIGQLAPGLSGLHALPGLLTDSSGLLVAGAVTRRLNRALRGSAAGALPGMGSGTTGSNQKLAYRMMLAHGWGAGQWPALKALWTGESGFNALARNPSSGAFGIPQALPASKMGAAAVGGNAAAQIGWGLNYIAGRYGTPSSAFSQWSARSPHWYGNGGRFIARRPQLIGVGDKQDEEVTITPMGHGARNGRRRGGLATATRSGGLHVQVHIGRIDATGEPGAIREMVRGEIRDAIADVADEIDRMGNVSEEQILS